MSPVTLVHHAKAVFERNEMPFGRDTCALPSSIALDWGARFPTGRVDLGSEPPVRIDALLILLRINYYRLLSVY